MGMFSWISGNRGDSDDAAAVRKSAAHGGEIAYDEDLIERLKADHQDLVKIFSEIAQAARERKYNDISRLLGRFKFALQTHIMTENVKFYVYVQNKFSKDPETAEYIASLRKEMDGIARAVVKFANAHSSTPLTDESIGPFSEELHAIGEILLDRVGLEENRLYSFYTL